MKWIPTSQRMPDDDECVLLALADGEVWTGFHDGDAGWRYVSADQIGCVVTHWMPFPEPPPLVGSVGAPQANLSVPDRC